MKRIIKFFITFFLILILLIFVLSNFIFNINKTDIIFWNYKITYFNWNIQIKTQKEIKYFNWLLQSWKINNNIIYLKYYYPYIKMNNYKDLPSKIYDEVSWNIIWNIDTNNYIYIDNSNVSNYLIISENNYIILNSKKDIIYWSWINYNSTILNSLDISKNVTIFNINYNSNFRKIYDNKDSNILINSYEKLFTVLDV
jgi:hypothetical protein